MSDLKENGYGEVAQRYRLLTEEVRENMHQIEDTIERFKKLSPDGTECACLKAIALFKPGRGLCLNWYSCNNR
jgi:hypothetical protein